MGGDGIQDAESLFRTKSISEIRNVEATTRKQISDKSEELRQLVGNRYRDLIDSADSIVLMKSTSESISANIDAIRNAILHSLFSPVDSPRSPNVAFNPDRARIYGIACRIKYLVDTPENIWGCLDESMFLEASARYVRAKHVHFKLVNDKDSKSVLSNFPLLQHQWQIVESFKAQISQRSREILLDQTLNLGINAYADALAAVSIIDELDPKQVLTLFLDSRKSCMSLKLIACCNNVNADSSDVISVFCEVLKIIQVSIGQVGELFLQVLNDMPLFHKTILGSPPASQLFGGIPVPDEEVRLWNTFKEKLESVMVILDRDSIAKTCSDWLRNCGKEITSKISGRYLIDVIGTGRELSSAEKFIRETIDSKKVLEGSLEWLKSVFGSEIELPWKRTRELVLGDDSDLWDDIFENAFVRRMQMIIDLGFDEMSKAVDVVESVRSITQAKGDQVRFQAYLSRSPIGGGVWFMEPNGKRPASVPGSKSELPQENDFRACLNAYFGPEVSRIRDTVDSCCESVLEDLLSFLESPKAPVRMKDLAPYLQNKCYGSMSTVLMQLKNELDHLYSDLENRKKNNESALPPAILVERSLFIGRLLFAFQKHSRHIPVILGSPRSWVNETVSAVSLRSPSILRRMSTDSPASSDSPGKKLLDSTKRQTSLVTAAFFGVDESSSPQLEELRKATQDLCIKAHNLWITWVSDELSVILSSNLRQDNALSATAPLRGWEETVVKQEQSGEGQPELKISLPSMPSPYITSFLFLACEEIHRTGGHVLDKPILQNFASRLLDKLIGIYEEFLSIEEAHGHQVSERGVMQVLLDLKFAADILCGGDFSANEESAKIPKVNSSFRRKQDLRQTKSVIRERIDGLVNRLSQRLDPIDWLTYEPYLWENEKQSYLRHAVVFGFFVQLNRMFMDTVQKLPTNSESNIMQCSRVSRFKYLPISTPALSSRGAARVSTSMDDISLRKSWGSYTNDEISRKIDIDENSSLGVAAPLFKSFMEVGSKFGESTLRLGSILTDGQVGRFGDILPAQAAGLLSSFAAARSDF